MNTDNSTRKDKIRFACESLNNNPNFSLPMTELMPLVVEVDALFASREDAEVEKSAIVERLRAQADRIEKAEQKVGETKEAVATAFDAYFSAQNTLKMAKDTGIGVADAETAASVAQAGYELAGAEHDTAEKEYTGLLHEAGGVSVSTESEGEALPEIDQELVDKYPPATLTSEPEPTETM